MALIIGIAGACRREELANLKIENFKDKDDVLIFMLPCTKTDNNRTFTITENMIDSINSIELIKKYMELRPSHTPHSRIFVRYYNGKCTIQPVGKNTFSSLPAEIARYLKLESPQLYTGHCFRRTSASLLADSGVDLLNIKRHGGWKSNTVAESYIEDSLRNKMNIANKLLQGPERNNLNINSSIKENIRKYEYFLYLSKTIYILIRISQFD